MVCSLRLCIATWQIKIKAQPTEIFSVSCAFFSFINHLFINDFCCSVANNYRLYFQNLFSYRSLLVFGNFYYTEYKTKRRMCEFQKQKKALTFYSQSLICHCNTLVLLSFIILPYKTAALCRAPFLGVYYVVLKQLRKEVFL